ncbi:MAG: hypothetical protein ACOVP4_14045 [Bacteriovoracaceae bacterium]
MIIRLTLLISLFLSTSAWAISTVENPNCSQQFVGSVEDVVDDAAIDYSFSKVKVIFKKLRVIKGTIPQNIIVDVLKHGPFEFIKGQIYAVQLQDGRLCWADKK